MLIQILILIYTNIFNDYFIAVDEKISNQIQNDNKVTVIVNISNKLYNKLSIIKIYLNKKEYELQHTTLMGNYYVNSGIKLFNQLPSEIKLIGNKIKFILKIKNVYK